MRNLVCVGACYLDTILSVPRFPEEDSKLRATSLSVRRGGNCPNSLEVLQQLLKAQEQGQQSHKVRPYLISCLPSAEGPASARVRDSFGPDSPVDFTRCIYREQHDQPASSYIIRSEATGTRTLVNYNDLPEMSVHEFQAAIEGLGRRNDMWVHFEVRRPNPSPLASPVPNTLRDAILTTATLLVVQGRIPETTLRCIQYLRQAMPKASISVEVEKPDREGLQELAAEADVVFYSKSWAEVSVVGRRSVAASTAVDTFTAQRMPQGAGKGWEVAKLTIWQSNGYRSAHECLMAQSEVARRASLLLCTWGAEGAASLSLPSKRCVSCPALRPGQTVRVVEYVSTTSTPATHQHPTQSKHPSVLIDTPACYRERKGAKTPENMTDEIPDCSTVGAGDTFIAGMLYGLLCHQDDWDADTKVRFAVQLATSKVQVEGFGGVGTQVMGDGGDGPDQKATPLS
ncbi:uncharacterized protein PG986_000237 [Apiospora aurea]|uniref:Carbohydrate kinase PfkB domain-containing protein n=1 Tax=Apiospora aurea TaxID=335848 RepID=A0ABR1QTI2_9PEZI